MADVLESTEIPDFADDGNAEYEDEMMEGLPAGDEQFAVRSLFVRLAERCLSHAHAKQQASAATDAVSSAMTDAADGKDKDKDKDKDKEEEKDDVPPCDTDPIVLKKKSYPRIKAAIENAKEMLETLMSDKQFVVNALLECVEGIAVKSSLYSALVYLMRDDTELTTRLFEEIKTNMNKCVATGRFRELKLLCRFVVELVKANCLKDETIGIVVSALHGIRMCDGIREDITYIICMTILWASNAIDRGTLQELATNILKEVDEQDADKNHCAAVESVLQTVRVLCKNQNWKRTGNYSSYFVLHPATAFTKDSEKTTTDFGSLELHPPEDQPISLLEHSCRCYVVPQQLCGANNAGTAFTAFDNCVYTDCINDTVHEFLDNSALCIKYLTSFIPVETHYRDTYNMHLINTLFGMMISPESPFKTADICLLGYIISNILHIPSTQYSALIVEARDTCIKNLSTMNPRGIVHLANWIGTELDATQFKEWNWEQMIVPLINADDHSLNSQRLFVDTLVARCCALDLKRSFASKPDFPTIIKESFMNSNPDSLNQWPEHILKEVTSQKLLSKLVTVCQVADMSTLVKDVEKESELEHEEFMHRFADCVIKVCSMSYLHCVGLLNQQYENISEVKSRTLMDSLWHCCGKNTPVLFVVLDKMTTAGLITIADAVDLLLADDDDGDGEMKTDDSGDRQRCVPWEALNMVIEKCFVVKSTELIDVVKRAVSKANEYAKRIQNDHPFEASLATSFSNHWQHLLG